MYSLISAPRPLDPLAREFLRSRSLLPLPLSPNPCASFFQRLLQTFPQFFPTTVHTHHIHSKPPRSHQRRHNHALQTPHPAQHTRPPPSPNHHLPPPPQHHHQPLLPLLPQIPRHRHHLRCLCTPLQHKQTHRRLPGRDLRVPGWCRVRGRGHVLLRDGGVSGVE